MIAHPLPPTLSVEEYIELEENSTVKHEYLDGHVYAIVGGTLDHGLIAVNVLTILCPHVRGGPYRVYNSDVKVRIGHLRFVYPDVSVSCDPRDRADGRAQSIAHPRLVVEVLSPKTAGYDQGGKFDMYGALDSLQTYVLLEAERVAIEVRTRLAGGTWQAQHFGAGDLVAFPSIDFSGPVADFYEDIDL